MVERAEIQDLLVDQEDVLFVQGALDFYDNTVIEDDDITILNNREALNDCIPQLQGKVRKIDVQAFNPRKDTQEQDPYGRFTMGFILTVDSVYGEIRFPVLL